MSVAKLLMVTGGLLFLAGAIWGLAGSAGGVAWRWVGHLPGDIRVDRPGFSLYFPLATCIFVSVVLTVLFRLSRR